MEKVAIILNTCNTDSPLAVLSITPTGSAEWSDSLALRASRARVPPVEADAGVSTGGPRMLPESVLCSVHVYNGNVLWHDGHLHFVV